jgi:membrane-associated protease RseP (regulator of RpoE activity)
MDTLALRPAQRPLLHLALFVLTALTIFEAFVSSQPSGGWSRANIADALAFSLSLVAILGSHEMGHWVLARRHGVDASLPYFIPLPHLGFGTLGAIIRIRSRIPTRNALVDIGAAGPLAGFLVAIPILVWGYTHAQVVDVPLATSTFPPFESAFPVVQGLFRYLVAEFHHLFSGQALPPAGEGYGVVFGDNLLTLLIQQLTVGTLPPGKDLAANPFIIAGWFGCIVTTLNLIPIGQLDGGHLAFANFGGGAVAVGRVAALGLLGLVLFFNISWLLWLLVATLVVGFRHPDVERPEEPLDAKRVGICIACAAVFLLCFIPSPVRAMLLPP